MQLHHSLRAALFAAHPDLARDPDRLAVFLDKGKLAVRVGDAGGERGIRGFEYRYRMIAILTDFAGNPNAVFIATLLWIAQHQPELLLNHGTGKEAVSFDAVILDDKRADLSIEFDVAEPVQLQPRPGGGYDVAYPPAAPIEHGLGGGFPIGAGLGEIYAGGELILAAAPQA